MGFLHVLGTIGKDIIGVATKITPAIPGPLGFILTAVLSVANQEINGIGNGANKLATSTKEVSTIAPEHPNKIQIIVNIINGIVVVLNGVGELYSSDTVTPPVVKGS